MAIAMFKISREAIQMQAGYHKEGAVSFVAVDELVTRLLAKASDPTTSEACLWALVRFTGMQVYAPAEVGSPLWDRKRDARAELWRIVCTSPELCGPSSVPVPYWGELCPLIQAEIESAVIMALARNPQTPTQVLLFIWEFCDAQRFRHLVEANPVWPLLQLEHIDHPELVTLEEQHKACESACYQKEEWELLGRKVVRYWFRADTIIPRGLYDKHDKTCVASGTAAYGSDVDFLVWLHPDATKKQEAA